jgi:signal peptidase II
MSIARRVAWIVCVLVCCAGCDRVAKSYAQAHLGEPAVRTYLADTVRLQLRYNEGAFLSLGASLPKPWREALLRGGVAMVLFAMLAYAVFFAPPNPVLLAGASLVVAGGTSNLLDRFLYDGRVVDFVSLGIGGLRTGVFNLADAAITAGAVLMLLSEFMQRSGRRT